MLHEIALYKFTIDIDIDIDVDIIDYVGKIIHIASLRVLVKANKNLRSSQMWQFV